MSSLHQRYIESLGEEGSTYTAQKLMEKIRNEYHDNIAMYKKNNKSGIIIHCPSLSSDAAFRRANFDESSVKEAAYHLRALIFQMQ